MSVFQTAALETGNLSQEERQRFWIEMAALGVVIVIVTGFVCWIVWMYLKNTGRI